MRFPGFIGPSYTLQSVTVDAQRCINLYPEMDEAQTGNEGEVASLVGTPGLRLLAALPTGPVRGTWADSTGGMWAVGGNVLYKISNLWAATAVGTLNTSLGPVSLCDNGTILNVVDGPYGYKCTLAGASFAQITDGNFLGATQVAFLDGYFIWIEPTSEQFYLSPINWNGTDPIDGTMIGSSEASPDNLVGEITSQEYLYLFGSQSTEIFYDSGNTFPFTRVQGAVIEIGCQAGFSIAKIQSAVFFLGQDTSGRGIVYMIQGLQPQRISTHAIEKVLAGLGDLSAARAFTYQQSGHGFYCLNLPGAATTWVFDLRTNLWHERAYLSQGAYERHPADCSAFAYNTTVVGDFSSGNLYALDQAVFSDNGNPIVRERAAPHLAKDMNRIFHSRFQLELETGVGVDGSGQGRDPQAMLQWSNDGGHNWSNEHWAGIGPLGSYQTRAIWRRLGQARDRVYRVRIADPVKVTLIGAEIDIEEGAS